MCFYLPALQFLSFENLIGGVCALVNAQTSLGSSTSEQYSLICYLEMVFDTVYFKKFSLFVTCMHDGERVWQK